MKLRISKSPAFLCKGLCFLLLGVTLFYLLYSKAFAQYIAPRYSILLYFTGVIFVLWGITAWYMAPQKQYRSNASGLYVLLIPLVLFLIPPPLATPNAEATNTLYSSDTSSISTELDDLAFSPADISSAATVRTKKIGIDTDKKTVIFTSENFYQTLVKLTTKLPNYQGYHLRMTGYILRDDQTLKSNEFTLSRMVMACCIADVAPMGITMVTPNGDALPTGEWYTIEGIIKTRSFHGMPQPYVEITKLKPAKPIHGYVYP